ncbi:bcl-2-binding component 3, isoforms 3/4-like [Ammospiza caudacuta]|uniref:bcl-2-binding component 3, isoforms 3/4-like n=1 Tax=Ammospiza caudacuta TaxID=2857398 RepID=UPI002738CDF2|nr:bcl-2-binding component 3, isoforms 3/4-like [Ammospiza caudacuta]
MIPCPGASEPGHTERRHGRRGSCLGTRSGSRHRAQRREASAPEQPGCAALCPHPAPAALWALRHWVQVHAVPAPSRARTPPARAAAPSPVPHGRERCRARSSRLRPSESSRDEPSLPRHRLHPGHPGKEESAGSRSLGCDPSAGGTRGMPESGTRQNPPALTAAPPPAASPELGRHRPRSHLGWSRLRAPDAASPGSGRCRHCSHPGQTQRARPVPPQI